MCPNVFAVFRDLFQNLACVDKTVIPHQRGSHCFFECKTLRRVWLFEEKSHGCLEMERAYVFSCGTPKVVGIALENCHGCLQAQNGPIRIRFADDPQSLLSKVSQRLARQTLGLFYDLFPSSESWRQSIH